MLHWLCHTWPLHPTKMISSAILLVAICFGSSTSQQYYYGLPSQEFYYSQLQNSAARSYPVVSAFPTGYPYPYAYPVWGYVPVDEPTDELADGAKVGEIESRTKKLKIKLLKPFVLKAAALNAIKNGGLLGVIGAPLTLPAIPVPQLPNFLPASATVTLNQQDFKLPGVGVTTSVTQGGTTNTNNFVLPG